MPSHNYIILIYYFSSLVVELCFFYLKWLVGGGALKQTIHLDPGTNAPGPIFFLIVQKSLEKFTHVVIYIYV
jgi:hypothetical protein